MTKDKMLFESMAFLSDLKILLKALVSDYQRGISNSSYIVPLPAIMAIIDSQCEKIGDFEKKLEDLLKGNNND